MEKFTATITEPVMVNGITATMQPTPDGGCYFEKAAASAIGTANIEAAIYDQLRSLGAPPREAKEESRRAVFCPGVKYIFFGLKKWSNNL